MPRLKYTGDQLWQRLVAAERKYFGARMALFKARTALIESNADVAGLVERALRDVDGRGTALRLLLSLDESAKRRVFPRLIELASVGHADIQLVRDVLLTLDRQWLIENVAGEVESILSQDASGERYSRFAELLDIIHSPYLAVLMEKAAASTDPEVREMLDDYQSRPHL